MGNALELKSYNAEKEAVSAAKNLEDFTNPYGCNMTAFVDQIVYRTHRTLQQSIGKLVFLLIKRWAEMHRCNRYDLRNEALCQACHNIDDLMTQEFRDKDWTYLPTV